MPPEESASQPAPESPSPAVEAPVETPTTEPAQTAPEAAPASTEAPRAPETAQPATPTAQIPSNEPFTPEPEPFDSAQDKPTSEPPSAAAPVQTGILHTPRDLLNKARVAIQDRKRKKRDKIMLALNTKNKITNDEVEKLLHVSDATATRYLSALEKEGKIRQFGKNGKAVSYERS